MKKKETTTIITHATRKKTHSHTLWCIRYLSQLTAILRIRNLIQVERTPETGIITGSNVGSSGFICIRALGIYRPGPSIRRLCQLLGEKLALFSCKVYMCDQTR